MEQLGNYLKTQREIRQIDIRDISNETKIAVNWLKVIEEDQWEHLPGRTFARGYAKAYARALGLDVDEVLTRYDNMYQAAEVVEVGDEVVKIAKKRGRNLRRLITIIVLLVVVAAAVVTWMVL